MNHELKEIIETLKATNCKTVEDGLNVLTGYFSTIGWSLTKDEWTRMAESERAAFVEFVINHIQ